MPRVLTRTERNAALDELEERFTSMIRERQLSLEAERRFLESVQSGQGLASATGRSGHLTRVKALAAVVELL